MTTTRRRRHAAQIRNRDPSWDSLLRKTISFADLADSGNHLRISRNGSRRGADEKEGAENQEKRKNEQENEQEETLSRASYAHTSKDMTVEDKGSSGVHRS